MNFKEDLLTVTNAKPSGPFGSFVGNCPAHNDSSPSLSINFQDEENPLVHCHAGCSQDQVIEALKAKDVWPTRVKNEQENLKLKNMLIRIWEESYPLTGNCLGSQYLKMRGLEIKNFEALGNIRFNPALYRNEDGKQDHCPALVAKITNGNKVIGLQRIYFSDKCIKLGSKVIGAVAGGHIPIKGDASMTCHLAEGLETGIGLHLGLNKPVWIAVNANNLCKVTPPKTAKSVHIWADKDKKKTGEIQAIKAANILSAQGFECFIHLPKPDIESDKKSFDYLDQYNLDPEQIHKDLMDGKKTYEFIKPLTKPEYNLPQVTDINLPFCIRDWAYCNSKRLSVPVEMIAAILYVILGSLLGRQIVMQPKKHDDWAVYPNVWGLIISPPGSKKTPSLGTSMKFIESLEREERTKASCHLRTHEAEIRTLQSKVKSLEKSLDKLVKEDNELEAKETSQMISELSLKIVSLMPSPKRYLANSFTVEGLLETLIKNPNGLLIFRDELSGLISSFKKQGHETDRQFLIEGWGGNGSFNHDTVGRGSRSLDGICLSILGGIQPDVIDREIISMKSGLENDGFIQRFQIVIYPNANSSSGFVDEAMPPEFEKKVKDLIIDFSLLEAFRHGKPFGSKDQFSAKLEQKSYERFALYMDQMEKEILSSDNPHFRNHLSKFGKLLASLILIFHVIDNLETKTSNHYAHEHIVERAIFWTDLFKAHARKLYDVDHNFEAIRGYELAKKIAQGKISDGASIRSIYKNEWSNLKNSEEVESGANYLAKHNWLVISEERSKGRPSVHLKFTPNLSDFIAKGNWCAKENPQDS